jgi:hypothetical protein
MRVLIFGAGASRPACYPLASELISATEQFVKAHPREQPLNNDWECWNSWRNSAEDTVVKDLLFSPNPEIVLSLPDLYAAALQASSLEYLKGVHAKLERGEATGEDLRNYAERLKSEEHKSSERRERRVAAFLTASSNCSLTGTAPTLTILRVETICGGTSRFCRKVT